MITTRDRVHELARTLAVLTALRYNPQEIWVVADGCTDGTASHVRSNYPMIRLIEHAAPMGSVFSRHEVMNLVSSDLVLSLDDDSYPEQSDCLMTLSQLFYNDPSLAVVTFPQRSDEYPASISQNDFGSTRPIRSFPNSGACLRVSAYRQLPGFEPMFFHMYEEPDYALQCVANGWKILYFPEISIRHHWTSNQRSELRNHHRHARNEFWSTLMRCPFPHAFAFLFFRVFSQAWFAALRGPRWLVREPVWWCQALAGISLALERRKPVSWRGYRRWLSLPDV